MHERTSSERAIRVAHADFAGKFEALIERNAGSRIEELFEKLLNLSRSLDDEARRHVREQMSEEELVVFVILTRPAPDLTTEERTEAKKGMTCPYPLPCIAT